MKPSKRDPEIHLGIVKNEETIVPFLQTAESAVDYSSASETRPHLRTCSHSRTSLPEHYVVGSDEASELLRDRAPPQYFPPLKLSASDRYQSYENLRMRIIRGFPILQLGICIFIEPFHSEILMIFGSGLMKTRLKQRKKSISHIFSRNTREDHGIDEILLEEKRINLRSSADITPFLSIGDKLSDEIMNIREYFWCGLIIFLEKKWTPTQDDIPSSWETSPDRFERLTPHYNRTSECFLLEELLFFRDFPGDFSLISEDTILGHGGDGDNIHGVNYFLHRMENSEKTIFSSLCKVYSTSYDLRIESDRCKKNLPVILVE